MQPPVYTFLHTHYEYENIYSTNISSVKSNSLYLWPRCISQVISESIDHIAIVN